MRKKIGFIKLIRLWGVIFLAALAGVIVGIDLVTTYHDFNIRMNNLRTDYVEQQKQMSKREVERVVDMINNERMQSEALAKKEIKSRVFEVYNIIQNIYEQNKALKSDAGIQKMIVDTLKHIRFDDAKGSLFIHSLSGEIILDSTYLSGESKNIINLQDSRSEYVVKKELELLGEKEEGFLISYWPKPDRNATKDFKKIAFVKIFKPYSWSIGTGLYVDDIEEQIKATWMERINNIRYGKNLVGYLFAGNWRGISLAHGAQPNLIGTDILEYEDSRGNKTSQLLIAASKKKDGGYANFWWRKPDTGEERPKIAYAKGVPEWELLVATGVYIEDMEENIAIMRAALNAQTKTKVLIFVIIVAMAFALFFILFHLLSNRLKKDFNLFVAFFNQAAFSNKEIDKKKLGILEFILLSDSVNHMVKERKQAEQALHEIQIRKDQAVKAGNVGLWDWDLKTDKVHYSTEWKKQIGHEDHEIKDEFDEWQTRIHPDDLDKNLEVVNDSIEKVKKDHRSEFRFRHKDGSYRWILAQASILADESGKPIRMLGSHIDISHRKQREDQIKASLKEKETLLQEIHHRVKNNMQIIASLLGLQTNKQANPEIKSILKENVGRVHAMSAIHESLCQSENLSEIDFKSYITQLSKMLSQTFLISQEKVLIKIESPELKLNIDKASPLGLVLNELISNSLKYAFPNDRKGKIVIKLDQPNENEIMLTVTDDGVGMPNDLDWKSANTLGLKLVCTLVENQLNGSIDMENNNGTKFTIKFNIET